MENTTYILLKDLPCVKAGTEYQVIGWRKEDYPNQDKTKLYAVSVPCEAGNSYRYAMSDYQVENNPEWFQKKESKSIKEQPIKVILLEYDDERLDGGVIYTLALDGEIKDEKIDQIKSAIESIVNDDAIKYWETMDKITKPEQQPLLNKEYDIVSLLRDCVSETWGAKSYTEAQQLFDKFLDKRKLTNSNEQPKKDYEIISYYKQEGTTKTVYYMESYGRLHKVDTEGLLIHSVRRSSDNEVFTIGDEVTVNIYPPIPVKIKSFSQSDIQGVCFRAEDDNNEYFLSPFQHTKKQKPEPSTPLFSNEKLLKLFNDLETFNKEVKSDWYFTYDGFCIIISKEIEKDMLQLVLKSINKITSDKKYTEEDLRKCFNAAKFVIPEPQAFEKYLQSLSNK